MRRPARGERPGDHLLVVMCTGAKADAHPALSLHYVIGTASTTRAGGVGQVTPVRALVHTTRRWCGGFFPAVAMHVAGCAAPPPLHVESSPHGDGAVGIVAPRQASAAAALDASAPSPGAGAGAGAVAGIGETLVQSIGSPGAIDADPERDFRAALSGVEGVAVAPDRSGRDASRGDALWAVHATGVSPDVRGVLRSPVFDGAAAVVLVAIDGDGWRSASCVRPRYEVHLIDRGTGWSLHARAGDRELQRVIASLVRRWALSHPPGS